MSPSRGKLPWLGDSELDLFPPTTQQIADALLLTQGTLALRSIYCWTVKYRLDSKKMVFISLSPMGNSSRAAYRSMRGATQRDHKLNSALLRSADLTTLI